LKSGVVFTRHCSYELSEGKERKKGVKKEAGKKFKGEG
jgi:hypothetical protein